MDNFLLFLLLILAGGLIAFANGANDNFKGVATLFGSHTTSFRRALLWATGTTALGSVTALFMAQGLLEAFSGKGLLPLEVVGQPSFAASVACAAGVTVLLATRLGLPVSTTHALIGALLGAGLLASPMGIEWEQLTNKLLLPLLVSPVLAVTLALLIYPALRGLRRHMGIAKETCVCIGERVVGVVPGSPGARAALQMVRVPEITSGTRTTCHVRYQGAVLGVRAQPALDATHYFSAGAVSFARGLNDTPKIAALLLVGGALSPTAAIGGVALVMAAGGWLGARRVADTMSHRVTEMNAGQGLTANLITSALVIGATRYGLPVSTTHVSCGSLFGIGAAAHRAQWMTIRKILFAWVVTLPVSAAMAALLISLT